MTALDRRGEPIAKRGLLGDMPAEVCESECDVPRLVLRREPYDLARAEIRRVVMDQNRGRPQTALPMIAAAAATVSVSLQYSNDICTPSACARTINN
jgi:hypothetical protein